ncbi:RNA 2'-phosphotransferase [Larkinella rosea]|uniref:Probable RNA 2'-phosphotransferase n=1 Tax=Larkinella rosea TaxID=2025312 RepID=A0A3P1C3R9_9BACT|nr:RNA 2'-phosphotransferase [Larkinella rosea]
MSDKRITEISKFLSMVLRHKPEKIGIQLDENGWTDVADLLEKSNRFGIPFDLEMLKHIVDTNPKQRFALNAAQDKIRANQGHSVPIELGYASQEPPEILYHGTAEKSVQSILATGLEKRNRQHVHLSSDLETALKVGQRHGIPFVFKVFAKQMYNDKFEFYRSDNGVWLTHEVPVNYLKRNEE